MFASPSREERQAGLAQPTPEQAVVENLQTQLHNSHYLRLAILSSEAGVFGTLTWALAHSRCSLSACSEDALAQQRELRAAEHLTLQVFETVDLSLHLPVAPVAGQGGLDGRLIAPEAGGEGSELG